MSNVKITIFGSYNKSGIGDKAILISLLDLLFRHKEFNLTIDVLTFGKNPITTDIKDFPWRKRVNQISIIKNMETLKESKSFINKKTVFDKLPSFLRTLSGYIAFKNIIAPYNYKGSDGLIIGGGNLLMDIYPSWPGRPFLIQKNFIKNQKPTYILGVGAFPLNNFISLHLLRRIVQKSKDVFVRDRDTEKFIKNNWDNKVKWAPDLAFSFPIKSIDNKTEKTGSLRCAVNVAPIYGKTWPIQNSEKYNQYIKEVTHQLFSYYKDNKKIKYIFYDTSYPTDCEASKVVIANLLNLGFPKKQIEYNERLHTPLETCSILSKVDIALTTRLHAGILALRMGKPLLAIKYQPKVSTVLQSVGFDSRYVLELKDLQAIKSKLKELEDNMTPALSLEKLQELDKQNYQITKYILEDIVS